MRSTTGSEDPPTRERRTPFADVRAGGALAVAYLLAALTWVVAGGALPGDRWLAVHLFTLGVLSNLVLTFTDHFARTLTRSPAPAARTLWPFNAFVLCVLVGLTSGTRPLTAVGASGATLVVTAAYWRLRKLRLGSLGARFAWIVRAYERAHGAFVHGAVLGLLMGTGVLSGAWYGSARLAHLHVNVLGWGILTLLPTIVFFGPTMVRRKIEDGADDRAARAIRHGATALTVGVLLLLASALGGAAGTTVRIAAGASLAVFAWSAGAVCLPVVRVALTSTETARWPVVWLSSWLVLVLAADAVVVAAGAWRHLDALGVVVLCGVLLQAIVTTLVYVAPMLVARERAGKLRERLRAGGTLRAAAFNVGVAGAALGALGAPLLGPAGAAALVVATVEPLGLVAVEVARDRARFTTPRGA